MIEINVIGKMNGTKVPTQTISEIPTEAEYVDNLKTTYSYVVSDAIAAILAHFDNVDQIILSNHDQGCVNNWTVEEERVDEEMFRKYALFVHDDIVQFVDTSRDDKMNERIIEIITKQGSVKPALEAMIEMGYDKDFAMYHLATVSEALIIKSINEMTGAVKN